MKGPVSMGEVGGREGIMCMLITYLCLLISHKVLLSLVYLFWKPLTLPVSLALWDIVTKGTYKMLSLAKVFISSPSSLTFPLPSSPHPVFAELEYGTSDKVVLLACEDGSAHVYDISCRQLVRCKNLCACFC